MKLIILRVRFIKKLIDYNSKILPPILLPYLILPIPKTLFLLSPTSFLMQRNSVFLFPLAFKNLTKFLGGPKTSSSPSKLAVGYSERINPPNYKMILSNTNKPRQGPEL